MRTDPTSQHILNTQKNPDHVLRVVEPGNSPKNRISSTRLCLSAATSPLPFSYDKYSEVIERSCLKGHTFFLDTCFIIAQEIPDCFWDALLKHKICITPGVNFELASWKNNPRVNLRFHAHFLEAEERGNASIDILPPLNLESDSDRGIRYYVGLLGLRKRAYEIVRSANKGGEISDLDLQKQVQRLVKDRGMTLAAKGAKDADKPNFLTDEAIVVRAFAKAVCDGSDVTILTRDKDLYEQFFKIQYLLDTHYRAMLIADEISKQPLNFQKGPVLNDEDIASLYNECQVYQIPAGTDYRVLPDGVGFVNVHIDRIQSSEGKMVYFPLRFCADTTMRKTLEIKGRTQGANTEALAGKNLQRVLCPSSQSELGCFVAVVEDRYFETGDERWSVADARLALTRCERGAAIDALSRPDCQGMQESIDVAIKMSEFSFPRRLTPTFSNEYVWNNVFTIALGLELMPPWTRVVIDGTVLLEKNARLVASVAKCDCFVLDEASQERAKQIGLKAGRLVKHENASANIFDYYLALLAHRKMFGKVCEIKLAKKSSAKPSVAQIRKEVEGFCGVASWRRCETYLKSSLDDATVFDDERLAVHALVDSVYSGRDTVVLTKSRVFAEQFWALASMLESHFRAWAIARSEASYLSKLKGTLGNGKAGFQGNAYLCRFDSERIRKSMPRDCMQVKVQCWLLEEMSSERCQVYPIGFPVEVAMHEMFRCKEENGLRNSRELGERNLHFQWARTNEHGVHAQCFLGVDASVLVGTDDFPDDCRLQLSVKSVPSFDLMLLNLTDKQVPFPWAKALDRGVAAKERRRRYGR